jgi:hypothetical protein
MAIKALKTLQPATMVPII